MVDWLIGWLIDWLIYIFDQVTGDREEMFSKLEQDLIAQVNKV